jgi:IS30 family transposase
VKWSSLDTVQLRRYDAHIWICIERLYRWILWEVRNDHRMRTVPQLLEQLRDRQAASRLLAQSNKPEAHGLAARGLDCRYGSLR